MNDYISVAILFFTLIESSKIKNINIAMPVCLVILFLGYFVLTYG